MVYAIRNHLLRRTLLYLPAASPLLPDLLRVLRQGGPANLEFLALGAHKPPTEYGQLTGMPRHLLMNGPWVLGQPVTATTMIILDNGGNLTSRINNIDIGLHPETEVQRISPNAFDLGAFLVGSMIDLTMTPPIHLQTTIWRRIQFSINPDIANRIHNCHTPPPRMQHFEASVAIPRHLLDAARRETGIGSGFGNIGYKLHGYIGTLHYYFEFAPLRTRENMILADPLEGRIICLLETLLPQQNLPPEGVDNWVTFRHVHAPIGEGRSFVTGPIRNVTVDGEIGPEEARGGGISGPGGGGGAAGLGGGDGPP